HLLHPPSFPTRRPSDLAITAAPLLAVPRPAHAVSFRFAASSNRIYVEDGGTATLSAIKAALPNAPLDLKKRQSGKRRRERAAARSEEHTSELQSRRGLV